MQNLKVSLVQSSLFWEDSEKNCTHFNGVLAGVKSDLIVLPEMFTTGFSMKVDELHENKGGKSTNWLQEKSKELNSSICGSLIIKEEDNYYNRMLYSKANGELKEYNKRHLFRMAKEHHSYTAGNKRVIVNEKDWRVNLQICYDLRFPVYARNKGDYDVLIYVANWPEVRSEAWKTLLKARAIENQCYVIGVNRVGEDGNGIKYSGDSGVYDPLGKLISETKPYEEKVETVELDWELLESCRRKFPVGKDADDFNLIL